MKKLDILKRALILSLPLLAVACDDDEGSSTTADFLTISSSYSEADGTGIVTIPLRNAGDGTGFEVSISGTATEDQDFEVIGFTGEGLQIRVIDDNLYEPLEYLRIELKRPGQVLKGNVFHTLNIISNCEDLEGITVDYFDGDWAATEKYGEDPDDWYGPYTIHFVQDEEDPTKFYFDNLYDSGCEAYIVVDLEAGTVYFPDQEPCDEPLTNSAGTFTFNECEGSEMNITLNFDGGDWQYTFKKLN